MLKTLTWTFVLGLFLCSSIFAMQDDPLPASSMVTADSEPFSDPAKAITVTADDSHFRIRLASNPTTGYRWYLKPWSTPWLKVISQSSTPGDDNRPGSSGSETWEFELSPSAFNASFLLPIEFISLRSWDLKDLASAKSTVFYVSTEAKDESQ